jgi:hypothetical protein
MLRHSQVLPEYQHLQATLNGLAVWNRTVQRRVAEIDECAMELEDGEMSIFDDRQKGHEAKFARDAELRFKSEMRRNKLLGLWAAEQMGLSEEHANEYADEVVAADLQEVGDEDVFRKISGDLKAKNVAVADEMVRTKMAELMIAAREELSSQS